MIGDGGGRREPDAVAADDSCGGVVGFRRRPQRHKRTHAVGTQRSTRVGDVQFAAVEPDGNACSRIRNGCSIRSVDRELCEQSVAVADRDQIVLGVTVLDQPGRRRAPGVECRCAQAVRPERVVGVSQVGRQGRPFSDDLEHAVVECLVRGRSLAPMRLDVGVRAAAVLGRHHAAVCGEFVGARAERGP